MPFGTGLALHLAGRLWNGGGLAMFQKTPAYFRRLTKQIFRFVRTERGATAVEFALIAPPFIATLIAILEVRIFLYGQMALQNAANQAARYFLTGQAENGNWTATTVVNKVCPVLFNCTKLFIVVQDYASFAAASTSAPSMYNSGGSSSPSRSTPTPRALRARSWSYSSFTRGRWCRDHWDLMSAPFKMAPSK